MTSASSTPMYTQVAVVAGSWSGFRAKCSPMPSRSAIAKQASATEGEPGVEKVNPSRR
jgi:hypothetical protein